MTSCTTTTTKTYRAASEFATKLRAAVPFGAFSVLRPTGTARDSGICVWLAESRRAQRPGRGDRASATSRFIFGPSDSESQAVTSKAEPRDPPNAECTGVNWTCIGGYNHLTFTGNMRAVVFVFVDLSWRHGSAQKKSRRGSAIEKKMTGGRRRRERGAGGRARCVWWPRCDHCGCAALKSARAGSRQKVSRRALRKEPQSDFFHGS